MVDLEAQRIRDEVIRAMAEQGEDIESLGLKVPDEAESVSAPIAMPAWERVAETAADSREGEAAEAQLSDEEVERLFLTAVFDDVRAQSADAKLVQPSQWLKAGLVPAHFSAEDWEMFVYEYLEDRRAERDARVVAASATPVRTATRAVGVPRILRTEEEPESEGAATTKGAEEPRQPERSSEASEELRHPERSAEGAESKDPERRDSAQDAETLADPPCVPCDDIVALVGKHSYYLYSTERMTDAYARWSFLASEDDRVLTFVECVRDESRKYPRPMEASSLSNEPFNLSADEIDELWRTVRDSGAYPDLDTVAASNGDVYYFSTEYLTPAYAKSLAEWNSVERDMFL